MSNLNASKKQSIQKTLNIQIGVVVLSVGIIVGILFLLFSFHLEKNEFKNNIKLQTKHLSDTFTQQLWLFDLNSTQQLCDLAVDSSSVIGLRLLDHNKNMVVENGVFSNDSAVKIVKELRYEGKTLVGYIEILFVNTTWKKHQSLITLAGICMMAFIITASFLLISSLLKRHLVGPLNDLQKDMIALTTGKFKKSKLSGQKTEIQNIIDVFNQMGADLFRRENFQKEVEHQLTKEKIFIEALIHTLPGLFYVYEGGKKLVRWNKNFETVSGFTGEELLMKSPEEWVDKKDQPLIIQTIQKVLKQGSASVETKLLFKNETIPYFLTATKFNIEGKEFLLGLGIDLSERKQLEDKLRQTQKMESIGNLAGGIAHDFNNLLYPIIGYAEMLKEDLPKDSPEHESAQEIFNAGKRGGELVKQILALSRQSDHKLQPVRIQKILKEVLKLTRSSIPSDIEMHQDIQPDCGSVMAEATQLHQIFMNLITNAYHAVEESSGIISVQLREINMGAGEIKDSPLKPGQYAMLTVSDNGSGIPRNVINNIFEPYFTTKEKGKGTGLGLAVVHGIVKEHKGDIKVYSEEGKGTTFNVYIPLVKKSTETVANDPVSVLPTGTERLLLVDDEESVVRLEKQMLERLGYNVVTQSSSIDALEIFKANPDDYDLVVTDMTMPNMTGDKLAKEILSIRSDIAVIICTGFSERINKEQAEAIGVNGFLMKPVVKSEMAQMVRKVLDEAKSS